MMEFELVTIKECLPSGKNIYGYAFAIDSFDQCGCGWTYLFTMHRAAITCIKIPVNLNPLYDQESRETTYIPLKQCSRNGSFEFIRGATLAIALFICRVLPKDTFDMFMHIMENEEDCRVLFKDSLHFIVSVAFSEIESPEEYDITIKQSCDSGNVIMIGFLDFPHLNDGDSDQEDTIGMFEFLADIPALVAGCASDVFDKLKKHYKFDRVVVVDNHLCVNRDKEFQKTKFIFPNANWCLSR